MMNEGLGYFGVLKRIHDSIEAHNAIEFTAKEVNDTVDISERAVRSNLARLVKMGLVDMETKFVSNPKHKNSVSKVTKYKINYDKVINMLLSEEG